jgi:tetratricopeptide (TPR) repeat protein
VRHDDSADLQFQRGAVDFFQGQWERAAERFREAIALKPDFSDAHYNLGHTLVQLNDRAGAIASFREAIRFRPDFAAAHTNLGKLLLEEGDREAAREAIATAARLAPDDPQNKQLLEKLK